MNKIVLPQIVAVGIYNSQVVFKNKKVSPNRKTTMFEIELPIGNRGISHIDSTSHVIAENVVICAKPGQLRHTHLPFKCYYIHMIVDEGQIYDVLSTLPNYIEISDVSKLKRLFVRLAEYYNTGITEDDIMLQSLVMQIVYMLGKYSPERNIGHTPKQNNSKIIEATLKYIEENLTEPLSLETLSEMANFSPIYFHKLFRTSTGDTLHEYVEKKRINKAIDLLISTEMTLTEIAYECGFSSQSYFSYVFKRRMKLTPRAYAKSIALTYEKNI